MQIPKELATAKVIRGLASLNVGDDAGPLGPGTLLPQAVKRGYMTREDLYWVARWKSQRRAALCWLNFPGKLKKVTSKAFSTENEQEKIESLLTLHGVRWPTASVILHFLHEPKIYPILDVRAMDAVGGSTSYNFDRWWEYVTLCRAAAKKHGVTMRELDKALWLYGGRHKCFKIRLVDHFRELPPYVLRHDANGAESAQAFCEDKLVPALRLLSHVVIDLNGYDYYTSPFLREVFGGLVRAGFTCDDLREKIAVRHDKLNSLEYEAKEYMGALPA